MTSIKNSSKVSMLLALIAFAFIAIPAISQAANYGYVNHSGNVMLYTSDTPENAIRNAPNISQHSGVILLNNQTNNNLVGGQAYGV